MNPLARTFSTLLLSLALLVLPATVQAAATPLQCQSAPLKLGIFNFSPFYAVNDDGQPQGILLDKLSELLTPLGCTWKIKLFTANRLVQSLVSGETDIAMLIHHPMLQKRALYSEYPIDRMELYSYQRTDTADIENISQLAKKSVVGLRGYGYGGLFDQLIEPTMQVDLHIANDIKSGLLKLSQHKADHLLGYLGPTDRLVKQLRLTDIKRSHIKTWSIYLVMSSHYDDQALMDRINLALKPLLSANETGAVQ